MVEIRLGGICKGCMIQSAKVDITNKEGRKLTLKDQVYTHHINLMDSMSQFIGKGNEGDPAVFSPLNLTSSVKSGYWFPKTSQPLMIAEIVNYKPTAQQVYITMDYEYLPFPAKPTGWLDVSFSPVITFDKSGINLCMFIWFRWTPQHTVNTEGLTIAIPDPPKDRLVTYTTVASMFGYRDGYIISLSEFSIP
jgi:hypothetical protein